MNKIKVRVRELSDFTQQEWDEMAIKIARGIIADANKIVRPLSLYDDWETKELDEIGDHDAQVQYIINLHKLRFKVIGLTANTSRFTIGHFIAYKKRKDPHPYGVK